MKNFMMLTNVAVGICSSATVSICGMGKTAFAAPWGVDNTKVNDPLQSLRHYPYEALFFSYNCCFAITTNSYADTIG